MKKAPLRVFFPNPFALLLCLRFIMPGFMLIRIPAAADTPDKRVCPHAPWSLSDPEGTFNPSGSVLLNYESSFPASLYSPGRKGRIHRISGHVAVPLLIPRESPASGSRDAPPGRYRSLTQRTAWVNVALEATTRPSEVFK